MSASFDLSGVALRVSGLSDPLRLRLETEWAPFLASHVADPLLEAEVDTAPEAAHDPAPFAPKEMSAAFEGGSARYAMHEGAVEVPLRGPVRIRLASTTRERQYFGFVNFVIASLAFRLPSRGGALLHAAAIVLDERAFLLVGPEGSGKSTWAQLAQDAGVRVLSDDVVVLAPGAEGRIEALATPFRAKSTGAGRWPVAAILLPEHGAQAKLAPALGLAVRARIGANLPFFAEAWALDRRVESVVDSLAAAIPARVLTFGLDPSFLGLLRLV